MVEFFYFAISIIIFIITVISECVDCLSSSKSSSLLLKSIPINLTEMVNLPNLFNAWFIIGSNRLYAKSKVINEPALLKVGKAMVLFILVLFHIGIFSN